MAYERPRGPTFRRRWSLTSSRSRMVLLIGIGARIRLRLDSRSVGDSGSCLRVLKRDLERANVAYSRLAGVAIAVPASSTRRANFCFPNPEASRRSQIRCTISSVRTRRGSGPPGPLPGRPTTAAEVRPADPRVSADVPDLPAVWAPPYAPLPPPARVHPNPSRREGPPS